METSPTSYLQTLAKDEAIAFATSLQKVKDHLSQSLRWLAAQVQHQTVQLQGIETLLAEAEALGLEAAETHSILEATSAVIAPATPGVTATGTTHANSLEISATENGSTSPITAMEPVAAAIAALPVKKTSTQPRGQQGKAASAEASRDFKPSASIKTSTAKVKQPKASTPTSKVNQRGKASNLQRFLKSQWRDKALTEAVSDILNRATAPLSTDEVMVALYDDLPKENYDRAKHSLANILSVGRSKGAWKSIGRGLYAGNAAANA